MRPVPHSFSLEGYENAPPLPMGFTSDERSLDNFIPGQEYKHSKARDEFVEQREWISMVRSDSRRLKKGKYINTSFAVCYMHTDPTHLKFARKFHERMRRKFPEVCSLGTSRSSYIYPMGLHPTGFFEVNISDPHEIGTLMT
ncbi:hypothetical protein F5877DRAFT_43380 [Lentinula edodes]|nr:hypothetical protein F5877DRAFT_43380 [Lentinula edodes]